VPVLKLATVWNFDDVRRKAIGALAIYQQRDPILGITLSHQYHVDEWFVPAVNKLAQRDVPFNDQDLVNLQALGDAQAILTFVLRVGRVRESFVPIPAPQHSGTGCLGQCTTHGTQVAICSSVLSGAKPDTELKTRAQHDFTEEVCHVFGLPKEERGPGCLPLKKPEANPKCALCGHTSNLSARSDSGIPWAYFKMVVVLSILFSSDFRDGLVRIYRNSLQAACGSSNS
jgi:hypothetical protein